MDTVNSSKEFHHIQLLLLWHIAKTLQPQTKGELAQGTCMEHIWNGIGNPSSQETPKQDRNKGSQQWVAHGQHTVVSTYQVWAPDVPNLKRTKCNMCEPGSSWRWEMDRIKVNSWNFDEKKFMNAHSPRSADFFLNPWCSVKHPQVLNFGTAWHGVTPRRYISPSSLSSVFFHTWLHGTL